MAFSEFARETFLVFSLMFGIIVLIMTIWYICTTSTPVEKSKTFAYLGSTLALISVGCWVGFTQESPFKKVGSDVVTYEVKNGVVWQNNNTTPEKVELYKGILHSVLLVESNRKIEKFPLDSVSRHGNSDRMISKIVLKKTYLKHKSLDIMDVRATADIHYGVDNQVEP